MTQRLNVDVVDIDHVAIRVSDLEQALSFYHELLGLPIRDRERYDRGDVPYVAVVAGGRHIHLVPPAAEEESSGESDNSDDAHDTHDEPIDVGGEHICLLLRSDKLDSREEVDALVDELTAAGVEVEADEPRKRYGAYGRAWALYVRDPDGRRVELKIH